MNNDQPTNTPLTNPSDGDKSLFAAYLIMGIHNAYLCHQHLAQMLGNDKWNQTENFTIVEEKDGKTIDKRAPILIQLENMAKEGDKKDEKKEPDEAEKKDATISPGLQRAAIKKLLDFFPFLSQAVQQPTLAPHEYEPISEEERLCEKNKEGQKKKKKLKDARKKKDTEKLAAKIAKEDDTAKIQRYAEILPIYMTMLTKLRNYYTHVKHKEVAKLDLSKEEDANTKLYYSLNKAYDAAVRKTKTFSDNEVDLEKEKDILHLRRSLGEPNKDGTGYKQHDGFLYPFFEKGEGNERVGTFTPNGFIYFICLFLTNNQARDFLGKVWGHDTKENDTQSWLSMVAYTRWCIRLPKPRVQSDRSPQAIAMDLLGELCRCPKELYEGLEKARQKDFERKKEMSPQEKEKYKYKDKGAEKYGIHKDIRHRDRFADLALAYLDTPLSPDAANEERYRLPYFRFQMNMGSLYYRIDDKKTVDGEYRLRRIHKSLTFAARPFQFGETQEEQLPPVKDLQVASNEITANRKEPYSNFTFPHYHHLDGVIAIYILEEDKKREEHFPYNITQDVFKGKSPIELPKPIRRLQPDFQLSLKELPGLVFYDYLCRQHGGAAERGEGVAALLKAYRDNYRRFVEDLKNNRITTSFSKADLKERYHLDAVDLTTTLRRALKWETEDHSPKKTNRRPQNEDKRIKDKLQRMIKSSEKEIQRIGKDSQRAAENKSGNPKKQYAIKYGNYARKLALDLLYLQPKGYTPDGKGGPRKVSSLNFQVLQAAFAQYSTNIERLGTILEGCNLFNHPAGLAHPFLYKVFRVNGTKGFSAPADLLSLYKKYFEERKLFLENWAIAQGKENEHLELQQKLNNSKTKENRDSLNKKFRDKYENIPNISFYNFLQPKKQKSLPAFIQAFKEEKKQPILPTINLPRGLFKDAINNFFASVRAGEDMKVFAESAGARKGGHNTIWWLEKYFSKVLVTNCGDEVLSAKPMDYYDFPRRYKITDKLLHQSYNEQGYSQSQPVLSRKYKSPKEWHKELSGLRNKAEKYPVLGDGESRPKQLYKDRVNTALNKMQKTEKNLRLNKAQDMLSLLMAKELLTEEFSKDAEGRKSFEEQILQVSNVQTAQELLERTIDYTIEINWAVTNEVRNSEGSKELKIIAEGKHQVTYNNMKLKNYGDLQGMKRDRRLPGLFSWFGEGKVLDYIKLKQELAQYEAARLEVLQLIHRFEIRMLELHWDDLPVKDKYVDFKKYIGCFEKFYCREFPVKNGFVQLKESATLLRNKFSHNQYPANAEEEGKRLDLASVSYTGGYGLANALKRLADKVFGEMMAKLEPITS